MQLIQPNVVGNFLQSYSAAQDQKRQQEEAQYNRQRQMRADERDEKRFSFDLDEAQFQQALQRKDLIARSAFALDTEEKWNASVPQLMQQLGIKGPPPSFADRGRIIAEAQTVGEQLEQQARERQFKLSERVANANIAQSYSAAAASNRANRDPSSTSGSQFVDNKTIDNESAFRKEYFGNQKDFMAIRDAYSRVAVAAQNPSAAGDLALIFNYMKMLDPGSVVREQEFANAQNAAGVPERVRAAYNNALRGERLTDATRSDFTDRAGRLFVSAQETAGKAREVFSGIAQQYGFNPERVVPDLSFGVGLPAQAEAPPQFSGSGLFGGAGVNYVPPPGATRSATGSPQDIRKQADEILRRGN